MNDKKSYVIHILNLKEAINHKLISDSVFSKTFENTLDNIEIKVVPKAKRRNYFIYKPNYNGTNRNEEKSIYV